MKRIICLVVVILFYAVLYAEGMPPAGSGTETEPYLISTLNNLLWLSTNDDIWSGDYYFLQTANIDARDTETWNDGNGMKVIGESGNNFRGYYNGDNHSINGLYINRGLDYIGLWGLVSNSTIENLIITDANVTGGSWVGCIAGAAEYSTIKNCSVSGYVEGFNQIGGIAGAIGTESLIESCCSKVFVSASGNSGNLIGGVFRSSVINSYSTGDIEGSGNIGAFVGDNTYSEIINCYSLGNVSGSYIVGGFVGRNSGSTISYCYCTGEIETEAEDTTGGFVGFNYGYPYTAEISCCIWNRETSGYHQGIGENQNDVHITNVWGKTTAEMHIIETYTDIGWDFTDEIINGEDDIWQINPESNQGYPQLYKFSNTISSESINAFINSFNVFPNPFNPLMNLSFELIRGSRLSIDAYNVKGQRVHRFARGYHQTGDYEFRWDASNHSSGIYFIIINGQGFQKAKKVSLIR